MWENWFKGIKNFLQSLIAITPENTLTVKGLHLLHVLEWAVELPQYQMGFEKNDDGTPKTFCNVLARDVLDSTFRRTDYMGGLINEYDYDIGAVDRKRTIRSLILNTPIEEWYHLAHLAVAGNEADFISPELAQIEANHGVPIHVISSHQPPETHECIICPDSTSYDSRRGVRIAQAGKINGIMYISDPRCFGWDLNWENMVRYVKYHLMI
jgi:hypothetical protein